MIICSAIKFTFINFNNEEISEIVLGYRHCNCLYIWGKYIKPTCKQKVQEIQGFMTNTGEFLDRVSARQHFINCNQGIPEFPDELYSEDLY